MYDEDEEIKDDYNFGVDEDEPLDMLIAQKLVSSKTEFRRLIGEGAITDMEKEEKINNRKEKLT